MSASPGLPPTDDTRWTMVLGAAARDPADQETFCRLYGPVIRAYLAARWHLPVDDERVADVTQEVFVDLLKPGGALARVAPDRGQGFRAFLYGVARNAALDAERRWSRRRSHEAPQGTGLDDLPHGDPTLSDVFDQAWAAMVVEHAFTLVEDRARREHRGELCLQVLECRYRDGLPPRSIAAHLTLDVEQVYQLLKIGQRRFRVALLEVMASHNADASEAQLEAKCADLLALL